MVLATTATFNIGGKFYTTQKETLLKSPSCRLALIVRGVLPCIQDEQGVYFIDRHAMETELRRCLGDMNIVSTSAVLDAIRDPKHFQLLLNWLRDGWCALPASPEALMELMVELRAYNMTDMEAWIRTQAVVAGAQATALAPASPTSPGWHTASAGAGMGTGVGAAAGVGAHMATATSPVRHMALSGALGAGPYLTSLFPASPGRPGVPGLGPAASPSHLTTSPPPPGSAGAQHSFTAAAATAQAASGPGSAAARQAAFREAFMRATLPGPPPVAQPAYTLPPQGYEADGGSSSGKWTAKYLATNDGLRAVVNTLLELAFLAPHTSLHVGKVAITISPGPCDHDKPSSLVVGSTQQLRAKGQVVRVRGLSSGWCCEFPIRPGCDITLFEKYNIAEYVQDNWFVLCAVLRDQFGILLEEGGDGAASSSSFTPVPGSSAGPSSSRSPARPTCPACARTHLSVTLHKIV